MKNGKKVYKINKIFLLYLIIFLFFVSFVFAEENITDYGKQYGIKQGDLIGKNLVVMKSSDNNINLKFNENNGILILKDKRFENINSGEIIVDSNGGIVKVDFTVGKKGGTYNIFGTEFYAPPLSIVKYDKNKKDFDGVSVAIPESSKLEKFPVLKEGDGVKIKYSGDNIEIYNGVIFSGELNFNKKAEAVIYTEGMLVINNIRISNNKESNGNELKLYFDGQMHSGNYASFGNDKLFANSDNVKIGFNFMEKNPYLQIDKNDKAILEIGKNSEFLLQNREKQIIDSKGLIPKLIAKGDNIRIIEDSKNIFTVSRQGHIYIEKMSGGEYDYVTTTPVEALFLAKDGSELLGRFSTGEKVSGYKLIVDNSNRLAIIPEDQLEGTYISEGVNTKFSSRISYNYVSIDEIKLLTGKEIEFHDVDKGNQDLVIMRLRDYWNTLSPSIKDSITKINFYYSRSNVFIDVLGRNYDASVKFLSGEMNFKDNEKFGLIEFSHESGHALYHKKLLDYFKKNPKEWQDLNNLFKKQEEISIQIKSLSKTSKDQEGLQINVGESNSQPQTESLITELENIENELNKYYYNEDLPIAKKWLDIAGPYDKVDNKKSMYITESSLSDQDIQKLTQEKGSDWFNSPRHGYIRTYGGVDMFEDISTYMEKRNEPEYFKPLIADDNPWKNIYRGKIKIMYEEGFYSKAEYCAIMIAGGLKC